MTKVLEEVAQNFECLDPDTLTLRGQELADYPVTCETESRVRETVITSFFTTIANIKQTKKQEQIRGSSLCSKHLLPETQQTFLRVTVCNMSAD